MVKAGSLRKRYILFSYSGPELDSERLKRALYAEALKFFGELGLSHAALKLIGYDPEKKLGIIRCERAHLDSVLGFLALLATLDGPDARLRALKSSGTIRALGLELPPTQAR